MTVLRAHRTPPITGAGFPVVCASFAPLSLTPPDTHPGAGALTLPVGLRGGGGLSNVRPSVLPGRVASPNRPKIRSCSGRKPTPPELVVRLGTSLSRGSSVTPDSPSLEPRHWRRTRTSGSCGNPHFYCCASVTARARTPEPSGKRATNSRLGLGLRVRKGCAGLSRCARGRGPSGEIPRLPRAGSSWVKQSCAFAGTSPVQQRRAIPALPTSPCCGGRRYAARPGKPHLSPWQLVGFARPPFSLLPQEQPRPSASCLPLACRMLAEGAGTLADG